MFDERAYMRAYRKAHREERNAYNRAYRATHPAFKERERAKHRIYREINREKRLAYGRVYNPVYYAAHRSGVTVSEASKKRWENPEYRNRQLQNLYLRWERDREKMLEATRRGRKYHHLKRQLGNSDAVLEFAAVFQDIMANKQLLARLREATHV